MTSAIWVKVYPTTGPGAVGEWAKVSGGTVTTVTNPDGSVDSVHTFTAAGTLNVDTPGYAECLIVGAGSNYGIDGNYAGNGGDVVRGLFSLSAGAQAVVVGAAGTAINTTSPRSSLGALFTSANTFSYNGGVGAGGTVADRTLGVPSSISGTALTYARGSSGGSFQPVANRGDGSNNPAYPPSAGIVIVRVQTQAPTISGIVASGGTESTYVGDGTNGVLNQRYKVHKFTTSGSLVVTAGGAIDVLCVGGGGAGANRSYSGGGGGVVVLPLVASATTYAITVGVGGPNTGGIRNGGDSSFAGFITGVGGGGAAGNGGERSYGGSAGGAYGGSQAVIGQGNVGQVATDQAAGGGAGGQPIGTAGGVGRDVWGTVYGAGGPPSATHGAANTGNGGGRDGANQYAGGSGIVAVRYPIAT